MLLKKIMICSFFLLFWHTAFSMRDDESLLDANRSTKEAEMRQKFIGKLNSQTGQSLYSSDYLFFSEYLSSLPSSPPMPESISYSFEAIRQNGTPFIKTTDDAGNSLWKHPERDDFFILEDSLLENYRGLDFLTPRKHPISQEQFSILKQNPNFYLEKHENSFFRQDPFSLKVKSTISSSPMTVCAVQTGCFLRGYAPSLRAYEDFQKFPQKRFSFRTRLTSKKFDGFLDLDVLGVFNPHVGYQISLYPPQDDDSFEPNTLYLTPEKKALLYAVKGPSGNIIRESIKKETLPFTFKPSSPEKHFKPFLSEILKITSRNKHTHHMIYTPLRHIYALNSETNQLDVFVLTSLPPPFGEQLIKIEASQTLSFKTEDDPTENGDEDWTMIESEVEQPEATLSSPPIASSNFSSPSFTKTKDDVPGLIYFYHHQTPKDTFEQAEDLFHHTISSLCQRASLLGEGTEKRQLHKEIKEKVSHHILQKNTNKLLHVKFSPGSDSLMIQGSLRKGEKVNFSIDSDWKKNWGFTEQGLMHHNFNVFLERCRDFCSQKELLNSPFPSPTCMPIFEESIPPEGYYLETEGKDGQFFWTPFFQTGEHSSQTPFSLKYNFNLCFGTFSSEQTSHEDALRDIEKQRLENFSDAPTNATSLILNDMVLSPQAETSLLRILETSFQLSSVTLTGCTFNSGFFPRLIEALNTKNLTHIDLTQSYFPEKNPTEDQDILIDFKTVLEEFATHHRTLTHLTFSGTLGVSQKILKKGDQLSYISFYGDTLDINNQNLLFLKKLMREKLLASLKKLTFREISFLESEQDSLTAQTMSPLEFIGLLSALGIESPRLEHLSITNCFEQGLPPEFFELVTGKTFHTLDLSGTPLFPVEGGFSYLNSLASMYPNLNTLILRGCFKQKNPLNPKLLFPILKKLPLKILDLSSNNFSPENHDVSFRNLPNSLEDLHLSGIFKGLPLCIIEEILRSLPNLKHLYVTISSHQKDSPERLRSYSTFIKKMKDLGPSVLFLGEEISPLELVYQRIFLDLTGIEHEKITVTPLNLSLCLDSHPLDPGYTLNFVSPETDFKTLPLEKKNLYLKPFRGEIHYAVLDPSNNFVEDKIPLQTVRLNFSGNTLTREGVESSLHHIFNTLLNKRHITSPRSVEFQETSPESIDEICRCTRSKFPEVENFGMTRGCFQTIRLFNEVVKSLSLHPSKTLQQVDFSENNFKGLFQSPENTYETFKRTLVSFFEAKPSLTRIIFTGENGERIEWVKARMSPENLSDSEIHDFELPITTHNPCRLFINPASAPENTKIFSGNSIYFFGSIENYASLNDIIIQDIFLDQTTIPLILSGLRSTHFRKSLTLSRCFELISETSLLSFFTSLSKFPLQSLHIEHVFERSTFHALTAILATASSLRELSVDLPNRDNHRLLRTVIGGTLGAGAAGAAVFFSGGAAAFGVPIIAGITGGSGATAGVVGGFSGSIADKIKARWDAPSVSLL